MQATRVNINYRDRLFTHSTPDLKTVVKVLKFNESALYTLYDRLLIIKKSGTEREREKKLIYF